MSRGDQYRVRQQPQESDDKKGPYVLNTADAYPPNSSTTSCMAQLCDTLALILCCSCLCSICNSNSDGPDCLCCDGCDNCGDCGCDNCGECGCDNCGECGCDC